MEFRCSDSGRRRALLEQTAAPGARVDAIDFLVVVDGSAVPQALRQRLLLVRLVFGDRIVTLSAATVRISGGVRVRSLQPRWVLPLALVAAPNGPASDSAIEPDAAVRAWLAAKLAATPDAAHWLLVRLAEPGDHSSYRFELVGGSGGAPAGFDRRLSALDFSFKVECPTTFDCAVDDSCPVLPVAAPEIDYLTRDFAGFRRLLFDRLALLQPAEDRRDPALLRTALVEVLAFASDRLSHHQDAVGTEAHLDTARLRRSVRRHARLLDYAMHEGCNARTFVHLELRSNATAGSSGAPAVPRGARFWTRVPELADAATLLARPWVDAAQVSALPRPGLVFEAMLPVATLSSAHNALALHAWGDADCCLPAGTTAVTLQDPGGLLRLHAGDFLLLEEVAAEPAPGAALPLRPDPAQRHVVRLTHVSAPYLDDLLGVSVVDVAWADDDAVPFALPLAAASGLTTIARGNLVLVDHGRRIVERDVRVDAYGRSGRVARLRELGTTFCEPLAEQRPGAAVPLASARRLLGQEARDAIPAVRLIDGDGSEWSPVAHLLGSSGSAREFVVEMETNGGARVRFGDDRLGRAPATGATFSRAEYRVGNGPEGNVGSDAIVHAVADPADPAAFPPSTGVLLAAVRNPLAARGGRAPESIDDVKLYAPHAFRHQERAVTAADWAEMVQRDPDVQRAVATITWTGSWMTVTLHVDRRGGAPVDDVFRERQLARLERYRLTGYDLRLVGPSYVAVDLAASVCVAPGFLRDDVERRLLREFTSAVLPDGRHGFFHPDEFTFGEPLHLSRIVARMMAVPGVREVDFTPPAAAGDPPHRFKRWGRPQAEALTVGRIAVGRFEIIRCDNDPSFPDHGRIQFFMKGGS